MRNPSESLDISSAITSLAGARTHLSYFKDEQLKAAAQPILEQLERAQAEIEKLFQVQE